MIEMVKEFYTREEINAKVLDFIHDMDSHLTKSHLVISRAGASTVGELTTTGTPSILIPFPYATDNHQFENAEELKKHKACWVVEEKNLDSDELSNLLFYILYIFFGAPCREAKNVFIIFLVFLIFVTKHLGLLHRLTP